MHERYLELMNLRTDKIDTEIDAWHLYGNARDQADVSPGSNPSLKIAG